MKDVFLIYNTSCFYEIVILTYFMNFSNCNMVFCSLDGKPVKAMEGFSVNVDMSLEDIEKEKIRSFIIPGGNISVIDNAGILCNVKSTHSTDEDLVCDKNIIIESNRTNCSSEKEHQKRYLLQLLLRENSWERLPWLLRLYGEDLPEQEKQRIRDGIRRVLKEKAGKLPEGMEEEICYDIRFVQEKVE